MAHTVKGRGVSEGLRTSGETRVPQQQENPPTRRTEPLRGKWWAERATVFLMGVQDTPPPQGI